MSLYKCQYTALTESLSKKFCANTHTMVISNTKTSSVQKGIRNLRIHEYNLLTAGVEDMIKQCRMVVATEMC